MQTLDIASVSFYIFTYSNPKKQYFISGAFTAPLHDLVDHSYPIPKLQKQYKHLVGLLLQYFEKAKPLVLVGEDQTHIITELFKNVERLRQVDVLPFQNEKECTRSKQNQKAIKLLETKTVRVDVDEIYCYATPLLRKSDMHYLHATMEAVMPRLRSTEGKLARFSIERCLLAELVITRGG